jgi:8-oxo-dGTP pyrophosphatase MutT (NUDIX family)
MSGRFDVHEDECPPDVDRPTNMSVRAAAVCFRQTAGGIEFLLVRTKARRAWTFPKGHVEPGETPAGAAAREAREEAGARGRVATGALTRYRYPDGRARRGSRREVCVEAYLMEVEDIQPRSDDEAMRSPTWLSPAEALARLAENREPEYVREHERLVEAALREISTSS